jgi:hypothetical protein
MPGPLSRVEVTNFPTGGNSVSVTNFPAVQPVNGTVNVGNFPSTQSVSITSPLPTGTNALGSVTVTNFPATQPVSGSVSVSNFPATQPVSGSVSVSNFPATQTISGSVSITGTVSTIARGTGSMATGQVAITGGAAAVQVVAARSTRRSVTIVPTSQFTYFYGNAGVTQTTGAAAPNGAAITLETTAAVFVVSGSGGTMTFVEHF